MFSQGVQNSLIALSITVAHGRNFTLINNSTTVKEWNNLMQLNGEHSLFAVILSKMHECVHFESLPHYMRQKNHSLSLLTLLILKSQEGVMKPTSMRIYCGKSNCKWIIDVKGMVHTSWSCTGYRVDWCVITGAQMFRHL